MRKYVYLVFCFFILYSSATFPDVRADISTDSYSSKSVSIYISGIIRDDDAITFNKIITILVPSEIFVEDHGITG